MGFQAIAPSLSRLLQSPQVMRRTFLGLALMIAGLCALVQHLPMT